MSRKYVISVMSKDRPGIIADITTVIYDLGGDLADLNQSILGGYFTMILMAEFDGPVTRKILLTRFSEIQSETPVAALIKEVKEVMYGSHGRLPDDTFVVTAQADNRKGLVKTLGDFFYSRNINVLDLVTAIDKNCYTMIFQVDLSQVDSMKSLRSELTSLGEREEMELVLQHNDIYMATNEVGTALETIIGD